MAIQQAVTVDEFLKYQNELPVDQRQNSILLKFRSPVPHSRMAEFYRIHLTQQMLGSGEPSFFRPHVFQPGETAERRECKGCGLALARINQRHWKCQNQRCMNFRRLVEAGPKRGVINVLVHPSWVVERFEKPSPIIRPHGQVITHNRAGQLIVSKIVLIRQVQIVLDRRYDSLTLTAVLRTACQVAEQMGMQVL